MNHCVLVRVDTCHSLLPLFDDVARGEESEALLYSIRFGLAE